MKATKLNILVKQYKRNVLLQMSGVKARNEFRINVIVKQNRKQAGLITCGIIKINSIVEEMMSSWTIFQLSVVLQNGSLSMQD